MLVLTRKKGEAIIIGKNIKITILETDDDKIKIGIDAPKSIPILRNELIEETINVNIESTKLQKGILESLGELNK